MRVVVAGFHGLLELAPAVAVHGAVEVHGRHAFAVGLEDVLDVGRIGDVGSALVMDDDVEVFVPAVLLVDFEDRLRTLRGVVGHLDLGVEAGFDALLEDFLLVGVVVAATASNDEDAQGLRFVGDGGRGQTRDEGEGEEGTEVHGGKGIKGAGQGLGKPNLLPGRGIGAGTRLGRGQGGLGVGLGSLREVGGDRQSFDEAVKRFLLLFGQRPLGLGRHDVAGAAL